MKKKKTEKSANKRLLLGIIVGAVVLVVVGLKILGQRSAQPLKLSAESAAMLTQAPAQATSAPLLGPALPAATPAPDGDPFPASPAAQIAWLQRQRKPAMILFHSTNCIPCKTMEQLVKKVRVDYEPEVVFVDVITNDRANLTLIRQAMIQAIPTTFFVSSSGQSKRVVGAIKEETLRAELSRLKAGQ